MLPDAVYLRPKKKNCPIGLVNTNDVLFETTYGERTQPERITMGFFFGCCRFLMVFTCLALSVFSTIDEYEHQAIDILLKMEILVVIWFSLEFAGRYVLIASNASIARYSLVFQCLHRHTKKI